MGILDLDYCITEIRLAILVKAGTGAPVHKNRATHGIACAIAGKHIYHFENNLSLTVHANELIYLPKYANYTIESVEEGDICAVNFDIDKNKTFPPQMLENPHTDFVSAFFQKIISLWLNDRVRNDFKIKSLLYDFLFQTKEQELKKEHSEKYAVILPALRYIDDHYTGELSVTMLANLCNISDTYFRKIFYDAYQTTPVKYVTQKRMELAVELLSSGLYSISRLGEICGYVDPTVFSRSFKNYYGMSPTVYLKKMVAL